eukprot:scaffold399759_cov36-Prasinocladus_malaysianus.AAC.1
MELLDQLEAENPDVRTLSAQGLLSMPRSGLSELTFPSCRMMSSCMLTFFMGSMYDFGAK